MDKHYSHKKSNLILLGFIVFIQLIVCLPHVGKGFITDDFIWIDNALNEGELDLIKPFTESTGFYRPLVSLTFGLQYHFHGMNARPYGLFNLIFHVLNIILIYHLVSLFGSLRAYALPVAFLFSFNIKSNPMAIGWISGRTSLLFAFFSLISLILLKRAGIQSPRKKYFYYFLVNLVFLGALFSKETALMVPLLVFLFTFYSRRNLSNGIISDFGHAIKSFGIFSIPLVIYFYFRIRSDAFSPIDSPVSYSFGANPFLILKNFWEYFFRSGLLDFFLLVWMFVLLMGNSKQNNRLKLDFQAIKAGCAWFMLFLLPVLFLKVRSNLYVYLPQVGLHVVFISLMYYMWRNSGRRMIRLANRFFILTPVFFLSIIWIFCFAHKIASYGRTGYQSRFFVREVIHAVSQIPNHGYIFVLDADDMHSDSPGKTVSYGFNSMLRLFYFYPYKKLAGEITDLQGFSKIKRIENLNRFFFWFEKRLIGPFDGVSLGGMVAGLSFLPVTFPEIEIKKQGPKKKRPIRFLKRKQRLRKLMV